MTQLKSLCLVYNRCDPSMIIAS